MPTTQAVEIDGQIIPADQAMAGIAAVMQSTDEAVSAVQGALAQPIGQALSDTQSVCDAVKKGLKKYTNAVQKAAAAGQNAVVDTLANYVRQAITDTGTTTAAVATAAATGRAAVSQNWCVWIDCKGPVGSAVDLGAWVNHIAYDTNPPTVSILNPAVAGGVPVTLSDWHNIKCGFASAQAAFQWAGANFAELMSLASAACQMVATWNIYYYCDPCADPALVHNWHAQVSASDPGNPWLLFQGKGTNFASQQAAQTALDAAGPLLDNACQYAPGANANCGTLPVPSPQPAPAPAPGEGEQCYTFSSCVTFSDNPCALTDQKLTIPTIGSPEFIQASAQIKEWFVTLGKKVIGWVNGLSANLTPPDSVSVDTQSGGPDWLGPATAVLSRAILGWSKGGTDRAAKQLSSTLDCWKGLIDNIDGCNVPDVVSLCVARAVIEILSHFRFGWDLILWGTFDLTIHIDPLIKVIDYLIADACPAELPAVGDTIEAWLKGGMDDDTAVAFMRYAGAHQDIWNTVVQARRERSTPEQVINLARRAGLSDDTIADQLRTYGFINRTEAMDFIEAYDELPTISDVLHFLQRNVFDADYVSDYGLMEGFDTRFWPRYGQGLRAIGVLESTAKDHYAAHWINPSIGQLAEMAQRLRPGRVDPSIQFQWTDFLRVLAEQDVAPFFRARLQAISFRTLPIRQLTQLVKAREVDEKELAERWQDIGYSPDDAAKLAHALMIQGEQQRATQQRGFTPTVVAKLFPAGLMNRDEAIAALGPQGFTAGDVDTLLEVSIRLKKAQEDDKKTVAAVQKYAELAVKAYEDGTVDAATTSTALKAAGYTDAGVAVVLTTAQLHVKMEKIDSAIKAIRKAFLRGEVNATEALTALSLAGVRPDSATDRVQRWQLELSVPRKSAARAQIIKWAESGIISVPNAEVRLINLGWTAQDVALSIAEIKQTIAQAEAKAAARSARQLAQADALLARAKTSLQKQYCRQFSPGKLKLWFSERIIDEANLTGKLNQCGYNAEYIADFIAEATVARDKKDAEAAKKGAAGIEYTGPGAITS